MNNMEIFCHNCCKKKIGDKCEYCKYNYCIKCHKDKHICHQCNRGDLCRGICNKCKFCKKIICIWCLNNKNPKKYQSTKDLVNNQMYEIEKLRVNELASVTCTHCDTWFQYYGEGWN